MARAGPLGSASATAEDDEGAVDGERLFTFRDIQKSTCTGMEEEDGLAPSPTAVKMFMQALEAHLYGLCLVGGNTAKGAGVKHGDQGYQFLHISEKDTVTAGGGVGKKPIAVHSSGDGKVVLNFYGRVSMVPVNGAIPVTQCWGVDFFITPEGSSQLMGEHCVPAWLIPEAKKGEDPTMAVKDLESQFTFAYTSSTLVPAKTFAVTLSLLRLELGKCEGPVLLTRPPPHRLSAARCEDGGSEAVSRKFQWEAHCGSRVAQLLAFVSLTPSPLSL